MLTRNASITVVERLKREPSFAKAALAEAVTTFLDGEAATARLMLRDIVNGTLGFEALAKLTGKPAKSLHRMLSTTGNPSMDNLAMIFEAVSNHLHVDVQARVVKAA